MNGHESEIKSIHHGVPQGIVLGPVMKLILLLALLYLYVY